MKKREVEFMKVNSKYVKESIDDYNRKEQFINEQNDKCTTIELNGGTYKVYDMSLDEFTKLNNAIDMNDIRWT